MPESAFPRGADSGKIFSLFEVEITTYMKHVHVGEPDSPDDCTDACRHQKTGALSLEVRIANDRAVLGWANHRRALGYHRARDRAWLEIPLPRGQSALIDIARP